MRTTICFDFGNTRLKYAVFKDMDIIKTATIANSSIGNLKKILNEFNPDSSIISSVISNQKRVEFFLAQNTIFHKLSYKSNLPFAILAQHPETIGSDRLALCSAAVSLFPKQNNLIISIGTCITYNFVNKFHQFLGGSISPGMRIRFKALQKLIPNLPCIEPIHDFPLVAYDDYTSILSGVILGTAKEIEGVINMYEKVYENIKVTLTGGDVEFFEKYIKTNFEKDDTLLFKGLNAISNINI